MDTIVTGYVPTPEGDAALTRAIEEARLRGARLLVVHSRRGDEPDSEFIAARERVDAVAERMTREGVEGRTHLIVRGARAGEDIVAFADEHDADLIVIGVRRRTPVGKLVLGSDAQHVVLHADCPVLCVKAAADS